MDLKLILYASLFLLAGLLIGSFLNIVIYKVPRKLPLFRPYTICSFCHKKLPAINNFPIISFIFRRNKCWNCGTRIPFQNILVEVLNGLFYLALYLTFGLSVYTVMGLVFCSVLIVISFIDWEFMIIPNVIVLPFTLVGLAFTITFITLNNPSKWWMPLAFSAGAFGFMLIIHLIYPRGMGMGDVKLSLMLGAFLVKNVVVGLFLGFLIGAVAGIVFIIIKKKTLKQFIPFGPFISTGGLIAFFVGDSISRWYTGFF